MTRVSAGLMAAMLALPLADAVLAQTKTVQGEMTTITATVEAVNAATRTVTLKGPKGNYVDIYVPESVTKPLSAVMRTRPAAREPCSLRQRIGERRKPTR